MDLGQAWKLQEGLSPQCPTAAPGAASPFFGESGSAQEGGSV